MNHWRKLPLRLMLVLFVPLSMAADSPTAPADPHQHLNQILERPLYRAWKLREEGHLHKVDLPTETFSQWVKGVFEKIGDFFEWLFTPRNRSSRSSSFGASMLPSILKLLAWLLAIAAVVLIIYFLVKAAPRSHDSGTIAQILSRQQVEAAMEAGNALALDAAQWLNEAQRLAAEQNFRAVYRALYLALLSGLHTAGKIEHNRNRTNWTYVQLYRGTDPERIVFSELTDVFDHVWYGRKVVPEASSLDELRGKVAVLISAGSQG